MQLPAGVQEGKRLDPLLPIPRNVADETIKGEYVVPRPQPLSVVAEARKNMTLGYFLPVTVRLGLYKALDDQRDKMMIFSIWAALF